MHNRSHIGRFQLILIPLADLKSELHKVGKRTCRILFQPCRTVFQSVPVQRRCRTPSDHTVRTAQKSRFPICLRRNPRLRMCRIPAVKLFKQRIHLALCRLSKLLQKQCLPGTRHFQFFLRIFLFFDIPHRDLREEFSDFVNQIRRILRLAGRARFRKGKVQPLRWFCQISVEMEFLLIHRLPRRRGEFCIRALQLLAVILRKNTASRVVTRNQPVVHTDEKQHTDILQT